VGSSRNPSRVHGGVAFGPKPRHYKLKVNKKIKKLAKKSVLSQKLIEKKIIIVDKFKIDSHKTKEFIDVLNKFELCNVKTTILLNKIDNDIVLGTRNIKNIFLTKVSNASAVDLLDCEILLLDKDSADYYNNNLNNK
jgi:large subunit ribosomal protein L4